MATEIWLSYPASLPTKLRLRLKDVEGLLPLIALLVHPIITMVKLFCVIVLLSNPATTDTLFWLKKLKLWYFTLHVFNAIISFTTLYSYIHCYCVDV